jgi:transaldolase
MEFYLDSVDIKEIEEAFKLGFLTGLTTTPTFMHREGVTDIDSMILKLSRMVPILQIEALGDTADEIVEEAHRQLNMGLDPAKTVFKIPVSLHGVAACKRLVDEGLMVNVHLVYTLQQAYMAMAAGATYVCVLVGRMQDQGYDALALVEQCVSAINYYGYTSKVMFSSVRNAEHVRNAITTGAHTITVPWKIMKVLTENNFTTLGTQQFVEHTKLITTRVSEVIRPANPTITLSHTVVDALVEMSKHGFGAVSVVDESGKLIGVFTDGDLRRHIQEEGQGVLQKGLTEFQFNLPISISPDALIQEAHQIFKKKEIDNIVVAENGRPIGMIDVQDLVKLDIYQ